MIGTNPYWTQELEIGTVKLEGELHALRLRVASQCEALPMGEEASSEEERPLDSQEILAQGQRALAFRDERRDEADELCQDPHKEARESPWDAQSLRRQLALLGEQAGETPGSAEESGNTRPVAERAMCPLWIVLQRWGRARG